MIKIIKAGNAGKATCDVCGCVFSFEYEDVELGDQRDPENFVECPCCGNSIKIDILPKRKGAVR
jgi:NAD-dependent SIR2 family protein deacetylase